MKSYRYHKQRKVSDSTKGRSYLHNPQTPKKDIYVQLWVESRMLATLSRWLDDKEMIGTRYMSEAVRIPLEMLVEHLVKSGQVELVESFREARDILRMKYHVKLNDGDRGLKNVLHNDILEERERGKEKGPLDRFESDRSYTNDSEVHDSEREDMYRKDFEKMKRIEAEEHVRKDKEIIDSLPVDEESGAVIVPRQRGNTVTVTQERVIERPQHTVAHKDDAPRQRTAGELDELERERARKDAEQLERMNRGFAEMTAVDSIRKINEVDDEL